MSSIICQEFPSCVEPQLSFENLTHQDSKSFQPISVQDPPEEDNADSDGTGKGDDDGDLGWSSFLLAVENSNAAHHNRQMTVGAVETEQVYVHPLIKQSSLSLSTKSLEMCTESLGSETGSNIDEIIEDLSNISIEKRGYLHPQKSKKINRDISNFPPPLTSISGFETTRVKPHRECGRLVLKAISSSNSSFQAERVNGRLKLYSIKMEDGLKDNNFSQQEWSEQFQSGVEDGDDDVVLDVESMGNEYESYLFEEKMEEIDDDDDKFVEMEEFIRRRNSCKEAGPRKIGSLNWGPYWVAIS